MVFLKMKKYVRQETLREIGVKGQTMIGKSKIAIIGLGALGTVSAELLCRAGIGELLLVDNDSVSLENIHRQSLYVVSDVGLDKVSVSRRVLKKINPDVKISVLNAFLIEDNVSCLDDCDLILDCTDNMLSRRVINDYCSVSKKTWIHAAASGIMGNVLVVKKSSDFSRVIRSGESFDSCAEIGVLNTLTTLVSSVQVTQALRIIMGLEPDVRLLRFNIWESSFEGFRLK